MREESGRFGEEETHVSSQPEDLQPLLSEQQAGDSSAVFNFRFIPDVSKTITQLVSGAGLTSASTACR